MTPPPPLSITLNSGEVYKTVETLNMNMVLWSVKLIIPIELRRFFEWACIGSGPVLEALR